MSENERVGLFALLLFILFTLSIFICGWIVLLILFIIAFLYYKKTKDIGAVGFVLILISFGIYDNLAKPLWQDYNPIIVDIAYELNIENEYEIQEFYNKMGYRTNWIGKASNIIYASANKIIAIPCSDTIRYDKFLISGLHLKKLKTYKNIPEVVFNKTDDAQQTLIDNSTVSTYGYR